jgi:N-acetyl-1-D-myo-inositol-2-amino-2-deoxy-alpha-D-glucopyranoside deacetylase
MRCVELAVAEGIAPAKVYWTAIPHSVLAEGIKQFAQSTDNPFAGVENVEDLPFGTPDEKVDARIVAAEHAGSKMAAVRAHATQIPESSWLFTLASSFGSQFMGVEHYSLVRGARGPGTGPLGWEDDLFAGPDGADGDGVDGDGTVGKGTVFDGTGIGGSDLDGTGSDAIAIDGAHRDHQRAS